MTEPPLKVIFLADTRPGHYHLAQGVIAALARLRPVAVTRIEVKRKWIVPTRWLRRRITAKSFFPPTMISEAVSARLPEAWRLPPTASPTRNGAIASSSCKTAGAAFCRSRTLRLMPSPARYPRSSRFKRTRSMRLPPSLNSACRNCLAIESDAPIG